jgi:anti-sigma-K factor RskA
MTDAPEDMAPDDLLAAEYVLGVQSLEERSVVARRVESDVSFAALVDAWVVRLMPLERATPEAAVPAAVKRRLDAVLFPGERARRSGLGAIADSIAFWRLAAGALFLIAATASIVAVLRPGPAAVPGRLVATLQPSDAPAALVASFDAETGALSLAGDLTALADPAGRDAELWVIAGDEPPRSLGLIALAGERTIAPPQELAALLGSGAVLAVSLEPPGGSPTGLPTGPVIASGIIRSL